MHHILIILFFHSAKQITSSYSFYRHIQLIFYKHLMLDSLVHCSLLIAKQSRITFFLPPVASTEIYFSPCTSKHVWKHTRNTISKAHLRLLELFLSTHEQCWASYNSRQDHLHHIKFLFRYLRKHHTLDMTSANIQIMLSLLPKLQLRDKSAIGSCDLHMLLSILSLRWTLPKPNCSGYKNRSKIFALPKRICISFPRVKEQQWWLERQYLRGWRNAKMRMQQ